MNNKPYDLADNSISGKQSDYISGTRRASPSPDAKIKRSKPQEADRISDIYGANSTKTSNKSRGASNQCAKPTVKTPNMKFSKSASTEKKSYIRDSVPQETGKSLQNTSKQSVYLENSAPTTFKTVNTVNNIPHDKPEQTAKASNGYKIPASSVNQKKGGINKDISRKVIFFAVSMVVVLLIIGAAYLSNDNYKTGSYIEYYNEAATLFSRGEYSAAIPLLRKANDADETVDATLLLGECYARLGDYSKASKVLSSFKGSDEQIIRKLNEYRNLEESLKNGETVTIAGKTVSINATGLVLDDMGLTNADLYPLASLYSLSNLSLENNNLTDLSVISGLKGINTLNLSNNYITDLSGINELSSLRILYLDNNPITDFSPAYSLTNLTTMSIKGIDLNDRARKALSGALPACAVHTNSGREEGDTITDISIGGYSFRSDVTELNLSNMGISDLSALSACKSLQTLDISGNNITDLTPLMDIPTLNVLYMSNNAVSDIRPLMGLIRLEIVDASYNRISSVAGFGSMTQLKQLNLSNNEIYSVAPLRKLTALYALNVDNNYINDDAFEVFYNIQSLQELSINDNQSITAAGLNYYTTNCPAVNVHAETISTTIRVGIYEFDSTAAEISASYMGLTSIQELSGFTNLQVVNLEHNSISNIYVFGIMPQTILNLDLSDNEINDITPLTGQQGIEILDLSNNRISNITPLYSLKNLKSVYLNGNNISENDIMLLMQELPYCSIYY